MNFWVPASLFDRLEAEAEKEGMTMSAWVQIVLLKRPERVVEKVLLPAGTSKELARIPTLEKQLAALTKDRDEWIAECKKARTDRDALKKELADLKKQFGTGKYQVKCPACKKPVELDLRKELGL